MDAMRQQPLKKNKKAPVKTPEKEKQKDKKGWGEFGYATTDGKEDYRCFCCGSDTCRLHHCPKKKDLPPAQCFNPEYTKEKAKEKENIKNTVLVTAQYLEKEYISSDSDTSMVFSGAQTVRIEDEEEP